MTIRHHLTSIGFAASLVIGTLGFAEAACFEELGCTDSERMALRDLREQSCDTLWTVRNTIYHENGYCFQTPRGRESFSNQGCSTFDQGAVRLNTYERANVQSVIRVERELTCR